MPLQSPIDVVAAAITKMSLDEIAILKQLRITLSTYTDVQIMRHLTTDPISGLPSLFKNAVGIIPDLEWPNNYPVAVKAALAKIKKLHIRVLENCHLRNEVFATLFPMLYPNTTTGYPMEPTIADQTINDT
ncbi:hypothetical protein EJ02DRAFT_476643 [Clathrospora elynae]|uniref:Uncharacterized protein n=1 Tax=Clathrospora elynae TaxID=706981 RepID=A0A6A5SJH5_9PLEO|nr:hypothetical protein EJ02DRAFT_476643 [Clathrospora elynae]